MSTALINDQAISGACALCGEYSSLQVSHVIPRFVWKWLKDTSPGAIRSASAPNRRIQDGPKLKLLCAACEQRFSVWERQFAETVFLPLHEDPGSRRIIQYGNWALKFAVSVSWRSLVLAQRQGGGESHTPSQQTAIATALGTWRAFLLGDVEHPGQFTQQLLPVDVIEHYSGPAISPFLNRYFLRTAQIGLPSSPTSMYIYTKMCRILLFGRILEKRPRMWAGTQLRVRKGEIGPREYKVPNSLAGYLNDEADKAKEMLDYLSARQKTKIDSLAIDNLDALAESEVFTAMDYDVRHSGQRAFSP